MSARGYVEATHAGPTLAVVTFTVALSLAVGLGWRTVLVAAAVLTGQLTVGWVNDYADAELDQRARRLDKPLVRGTVTRGGLLTGIGVALVLTVVLSLLLGWRAGLAQLVGVACGWAYDAGLKRTSVSPLPYLAAFALVPTSVVVLALPGASTPRAAVVAASGLLGASAHFTNAIKDLEADALTGVRGLPQRIGPRWSGVVSGVLLLGGSVLLLAGAELPAAAVAFAGAAGAVAIGYVLLVLAGRVVRHAFSLNVLAVGLLVAAVVSSGSRIVV